MKEEQPYDLEERLLGFGARIVTLTKAMGSEYADRHIANQLLRAGTAPLSHHGEAQAAESQRDFIHKMHLALKELRESQRWLRLIDRSKLIPNGRNLEPLLDETDQLIRIFVSSIATARKNQKDRE
ncbi:four helix bundle protein [Haloferula sp.]|uniref:four helix bundle protein n=1 Tax=Haloferula sp. TaxID=2497595 RepID=UPI0032A0EE5A